MVRKIADKKKLINKPNANTYTVKCCVQAAGGAPSGWGKQRWKLIAGISKCWGPTSATKILHNAVIVMFPIMNPRLVPLKRVESIAK